MKNVIDMADYYRMIAVHEDGLKSIEMWNNEHHKKSPTNHNKIYTTG